MDTKMSESPGASASKSGPGFPFLSSIQLKGLSIEQSGLILSVRILEEDFLAKSMSGEEVKRSLFESFPPSRLFSLEIQAIPATYGKIRDLLDRYGADLQQNSSHRIINTLAHSLYEEPEDRNVAVQVAKYIISKGRRASRPEHDDEYRSREHKTGPDVPQTSRHKMSPCVSKKLSRSSSAISDSVARST